MVTFFFMYRYVLILLCLGLVACSSPENREPAENSSNRELEFTADIRFLRTDQSEISKIKAAVADTDELRSAGLMDVHSLPENSGMIFLFENNRARSFWMANTPLSLDILFVNSDMEIVRIHRDTTPYSQESIESERPAKYVIEVNAGYTLQHDITEGQLVEFDLPSND
jgi:uncharacterized membrane protein (UPF0127 family)